MAFTRCPRALTGPWELRVLQAVAELQGVGAAQRAVMPAKLVEAVEWVEALKGAYRE